MAIVNSTTGVWVNADGLRVKYGATAEATSGKGGEYCTYGPQQVTEIDVVGTALVDAVDDTNVYILDYDAILPEGCVIEKAEFMVTTAFDSTSNNVALNFGLVRQTDYTTIIDADGIMNTVAKTVIDLAGNLVVTQAVGSYPDITTYVGAVLGTATAYPSVVCAYWENNAPTQGAGKLRLYWRHTA